MAARIESIRYREIQRGSLPVLHVGRQLRIDPADLAGYLGREAP